jgi:hypothetical protein
VNQENNDSGYCSILSSLFTTEDVTVYLL